MNARRSSAALIALLAGCASSEPKTQQMYGAPKMPPVPPRQDVAIDPALQQKASAEIAAAFASRDPVIRAQSLEAMARTTDANASARVSAALADREWLVRFAAALCAGDLRLVAARGALTSIAADPNANVRVAVRYALHRLADTSRTKELEVLAQHPDERVRANVALCLGLLGEPTGTRVLHPMLNDPADAVRLAAAEALWLLGDQLGLKNLVAGTISPYPDEQIVCTLALARPRDANVREFLIGKLAITKKNDQYVELQLAAARALGMIGDDGGFGVALAAAKDRSPLRRSMAALALGAIRRPDAQPALARLLEDNDAGIRLAAALAIRQLPLPATAR